MTDNSSLKNQAEDQFRDSLNRFLDSVESASNGVLSDEEAFIEWLNNGFLFSE